MDTSKTLALFQPIPSVPPCHTSFCVIGRGWGGSELDSIPSTNYLLIKRISMSDKELQLYEDILRFLEYENEVYGAFTITEADEVNHEEIETESKPIIEEEAEEYSTKVSEEPTSLEEKLEACSSLKE